MKDVIKWTLILIMAGIVFYLVCPKYQFSTHAQALAVYRYNKITGNWQMRGIRDDRWRSPHIRFLNLK